MKEEELRKHAHCSICKKKIGHTGLPLFWRVGVERFGVDLNAARRLDGLAMMLGGNSFLASVMGPDEDLAKPIMDKLTLTLCEECSLSDVSVAAMAEIATEGN